MITTTLKDKVSMQEQMDNITRVIKILGKNKCILEFKNTLTVTVMQEYYEYYYASII